MTTRGHIQLCSLSTYKNYASKYETKLFIVRSPGRINYEKYNMIHVPELSPSNKLFQQYKSKWSKGTFTQAEQAILDKLGSNDGWDLYIPAFLKEMQRPDMQFYLNRIMEVLDEGKDILLICFCADPFKCHRGLIGDYFNNLGYEVRYN